MFIILPDSEKFLNEEQISSGNAYLQKQDADKCPNISALENAEAMASPQASLNQKSWGCGVGLKESRLQAKTFLYMLIKK